MRGRETNVFMVTTVVPGQTRHHTLVSDDLIEGFAGCTELAHEDGLDFTRINFERARDQIESIVSGRTKIDPKVMARVDASGGGHNYMLRVTKGVRL